MNAAKAAELKQAIRGLIREIIQEGDLVESVVRGVLDDSRAYRNHPNPSVRQFADLIGAHRTLEAHVAPDGETYLGVRFARIARAVALAKHEETGRAGAVRIIADRYGDKATADACAKAMESGDPASGGLFVPEEIADELVPLVRANLVLRQLGARSIPMVNGNMTIIRITGGTAASYVGETASGTGSKLSTGRMKLTEKKLRGLTVITNDLLRISSVDADMWVRDDLVDAVVEKMEWAGLLGTGTEHTPRGLFNTEGLTSLTINARLTADDPVQFLVALLNAKIRMRRPGWLFNPTILGELLNLATTTGAYHFREEMLSNGTLLGYPWQITQQIENGTDPNEKTKMVLGDWNEFVIGQTRIMEVASSTEATVTDESGNKVDLFDQDMSAIRVIDSHDMGLRRPAAFAVAKDVHTKT